MQKIQVTAIDVGSSKITAVAAERGVNKTFVIKSEKSFPYEGFAGGEILDPENFKRTLVSCADYLKNSSKSGCGTIYVGVPSAFTQVFVKDSQISFQKKKKITAEDVETLFDGAFVMKSGKYSLINRSAIVYELDDYRRLASPVGAYSEILKGKLSFVVCDNRFIDTVSSVLKVGGAERIEFVSTSLAEAMYLLGADARDRIAEILDVGYISSTFSVVQGDGILFEKSFDYGGGYITAALTEKFGISFEEAEKIKRKVNLSKISVGAFDVIESEDGRYYNAAEVIETVAESLDLLCENVENAIEESGYVIPEYVPLFVTGGGITYIRGAKAHLSARLGGVVDVIAPKVPLMDKPIKSSELSLLDIALEQNV